jgi:hypothetical protein
MSSEKRNPLAWIDGKSYAAEDGYCDGKSIWLSIDCGYRSYQRYGPNPKKSGRSPD